MKISEWLKELLVAGIIGNLSGLFDGINDKVAQITDVVGMTPQQWNGGVFSMVKNLSETVVTPIAGIILTAVACIELLSMMILPGACVIMFGLMYHNRKKLTDEAHPVVGRRLTDRQPIFGGEGRTVFVAMGIIFLIGLAVCYFSELAGNPKLA